MLISEQILDEVRHKASCCRCPTDIADVVVDGLIQADVDLREVRLIEMKHILAEAFRSAKANRPFPGQHDAV